MLLYYIGSNPDDPAYRLLASVKAFQAGSVVEGQRVFRNSPMFMKGKAVGTPAYKRNEFFLNAIKYYHEQYKPTIRK